MDKIFFEFPLCSLSYPAEGKVKLSMIINYCIVERSKKIQTDIEDRINNLELEDIPKDFNKKKLTHKKILLAADELGISLGSVLRNIHLYELLSNHIKTFKLKHGNDSFCQIGKKLCFETIDGQFPYKEFAVLCAIQSIIGKKAKFKRVTKDRIRFAMYGFKSKEVALKELKGNEELLSDRQLGTVIDILHAKKFFSKFTYANRQTFFSTKLNDNELFEAVKNSKIFWTKKKLNLNDRQVSNEIRTELENLKLIPCNQQLKTGS